MGCGSSSSSGASRGPGASNRYHDNHPGLRDKPGGGRESEITDDIRAPDPNDTIAIKVNNVDLKLDLNTKQHHTSDYDITEQERLVLRRGQQFELDIDFNRPYVQGKDDLKLVFRFGKTPKVPSNSHAEFVVSNDDLSGAWGAKFKSQSGNRVTFSVTSPPDCYVGKWNLSVDVVKRAEERINVYRKHVAMVYILFNPWCKDDFVYLSDESQLEEYVMNDHGRIYNGGANSITYKSWFFGQFEDIILDCALYLLDEKSGFPDRGRGFPPGVVREISALVNASDEGGVLVGNWTNSYAGGTSPLKWTGSVKILHEFYRTKQPVRFGQCWVFSGVVTTLCRALGIPCRSVTNFNSAHDTNASTTIDYYFNEDYSRREDMGSDSVWNFHVWNDVWMARPDLPSGYGGWQAIDATPQETSYGVYCLGPVSHVAVKNGEVHYGYDGQFAFAEVNADKVYWVIKKNGEQVFAGNNPYSIGRYISTKTVKGNDREDITNQYKHKEGSKEERAAVINANLRSSKPGIFEKGVMDVEFSLFDFGDVYMGQPALTELRIANKGGEERSISGHITISSMNYTGVTFKKILQHKIEALVVKGGENTAIQLSVDEKQYLDSLADGCFLKVSALCIVSETNQPFCEVENIRLKKPHLSFKVPDSVKLGDAVDVKVSFTNPLSVDLTNCEIETEGPGLSDPITQKARNVPSKQESEEIVTIKPRKRGKRTFAINFNSNQILSINGSVDIMVQ